MKNIDDIKFNEKTRKQAGMYVPEGFFEQFQEQLEAKIDTLEAIKERPIVDMPHRSNLKFTRWSIAAGVSLLIGIGSFLMMGGYSQDLNSGTSEEIAQVETIEEDNYMEDLVIRSVNDFDLYEYYCEL